MTCFLSEMLQATALCLCCIVIHTRMMTCGLFDEVLQAYTVLIQAAKLRRTMTEAGNKKQSNRIAHSAPGSVKVKSARTKKVVAEVE